MGPGVSIWVHSRCVMTPGQTFLLAMILAAVLSSLAHISRRAVFCSRRKSDVRFFVPWIVLACVDADLCAGGLCAGLWTALSRNRCSHKDRSGDSPFHVQDQAGDAAEGFAADAAQGAARSAVASQ